MSGNNTARRGICYWTFNYEPRWEASSKEVELLVETFRDEFGTRLISLDQWGEHLKLFGRDRHLPLPWAVPGLPLILREARKVDINHVLSSPGERFVMPRLAGRGRSVLTITKQNATLDGLERNIESLKTFDVVVAESERYRDLLMQVGLSAERVRLIYPGQSRHAYRPAPGPFTVLFATSPRKHDLLARGIRLMIRAAERLPDVRFRFVWRRNPEAVQRLFRRLDLPNVELIAGFVEDMGEMYDSVDTVILPALTDNTLKPAPHSGLECLAHGKPLLVSDRVSLARIVRAERCGVVFEPDVDSLCEAIVALRDDYETYRRRAHPTVDRWFSKAEFIDRYRRLYLSLLNG